MSWLILNVRVSETPEDNVLNTLKVVGAVSENVSCFLLFFAVFLCENGPRTLVSFSLNLAHTGGAVIRGFAVVRMIRSVEKTAVRTRMNSCAATPCPVRVRFAMSEKTRVTPEDSVAAGAGIKASVVTTRAETFSAEHTGP